MRTQSLPDCPAGRYNNDSSGDVTQHDHIEDCVVCQEGKFSVDLVGCDTCLDGEESDGTACSACGTYACPMQVHKARTACLPSSRAYAPKPDIGKYSNYSAGGKYNNESIQVRSCTLWYPPPPPSSPVFTDQFATDPRQDASRAKKCLHFLVTQPARPL